MTPFEFMGEQMEYLFKAGYEGKQVEANSLDGKILRNARTGERMMYHFNQPFPMNAENLDILIIEKTNQELIDEKIEQEVLSDKLHDNDNSEICEETA